MYLIKHEETIRAHGSSPARRDGTVRRGAAGMAVLALLGVGGCTDVLDTLLEVEAPSQVEASSAEVPANAKLLVDGAVADFDCALGHYINTGGLLGEELTDAQQTAAQWDLDRRTILVEGGYYATSTCNDRIGAYTPLSIARWEADNILKKLEAWTDAEVTNRTALMATAAAYSGYAHTLMGEGFCTAAFDAGPELSRAQVFERAEDRFTRAIASAAQAGRTDLANLARLGRARARLNAGRLADAASDARLIPEGFVFNANYSSATTRTENTVWVQYSRSQNTTVESFYQGLTVEGVKDVRVSLTDLKKKGTNNKTPLFTPDKYTSAVSPIPIARWAEAQLIIAEAEGGASAVAIIDKLRAKRNLPAYSGPKDAASVKALIIEERRRELFLESHHLGDLIRYAMPLRPAPGTPWFNGGSYGSVRCMPLPDVERLNNPTLKGGE